MSNIRNPRVYSGSIKYPFRTEAQEAALSRLPSTAYAECDMPFLFTQRYSISPDFENSDVLAKRQVDVQGAQDMQYFLHRGVKLGYNHWEPPTR